MKSCGLEKGLEDVNVVFSRFLNYSNHNRNTHTCEQAAPDTSNVLVKRILGAYKLHIIDEGYIHYIFSSRNNYETLI